MDESNFFCDINGMLIFINMCDQIRWFWNDVYYFGIKFFNMILIYINGVEGFEEVIKNVYIGCVYFYCVICYLNLVFQFKDIFLLIKVILVFKQNYVIIDCKVILDMIIKDMEFVVEWVFE